MPILYEDTDRAMRYHGGKLRKLGSSPSLATYLIIFGAGMVVGGALVYGPTREALIATVAKGARVPAEKVKAWAEA